MTKIKGLEDCWLDWWSGHQGPPLDIQRSQPSDRDTTVMLLLLLWLHHRLPTLRWWGLDTGICPLSLSSP